MKRLYIIISFTLLAILHSCNFGDEENLSGNIYGIVSDKATGDPVKSAGVELSPSGLKTITGTDGQFEFTELEPGGYKLIVTKTGYSDHISSTINVVAAKTAKGDVQIERLPPALKIVNDKQQEISEIDFGASESDISRSFNIFNDGVETLEWQVTKTAGWISEISKTEGTLSPGATQALIMTIDRLLLEDGSNTTTVHITSDNGSKQLTVKATNNVVMATLNTLEASSVKTTSAVLNGEILTDGTPKYTERGFVYSLSSMPTLENSISKLTTALTEDKTFSATVTGLTTNQKYFVRAYAINSGRAAYSSNEITFTPDIILPVVITNNLLDKSVSNGAVSVSGTIEDAGDPAYTERGFVYGTIHNPTVESDTKVTVSGVGTGEYSINIRGLEMGTVYYLRAYATNVKGTAYGKEITVDMSAVMPEVLTDDFEILSDTSAILYGNIRNVGDPAYTERGFVYGTELIPEEGIGDTKKIVANGTGLGAFSIQVSYLKSNNTYNVRAYAVSPAGIVYGEVKSLDMRSEYDKLPTFQYQGDTYRVYPDTGEELSRSQAMDFAAGLTFGGYSDWMLPTKEILNIMYVLRNEIGGFSEENYWSSSIYPYSYYYYLNFRTGQILYTDRDYYRIRPIRLEK